MNNMKNIILAAVSVIGSFITHFLGGWDIVFHTLFAFILVDFISGCMVALVWKRSNKTEGGGYDSRAGFKGICRKLLILLAVAEAYHLDQLTGFNYIRTGVCIFFIANEGLSFLENLGMMGVKYPKFLRQALEVLREKGDDPNGANEADDEAGQEGAEPK